MSVIQKFLDGVNNKNESKLNEVIHDEYRFMMHTTGRTLSKSDLIGWCMSGGFSRDKQRIIYENDVIAVEHALVSFESGDVEAVLSVHTIQEGQIIYSETGATPMPKVVC